jgi:hypothetical protein
LLWDRDLTERECHLTALRQLSETRQYCVWARDDLTAVVWRDRQHVQIVKNMHCSPTNCNFRDAHGNGIKQVIIHSTTNIWVILTEGQDVEQLLDTATDMQMDFASS